MTPELYIGLMSGTSLDAVDAVVVSIDANNTKLMTSAQHPIPDELRQRVLAMCTGQATTLYDVGLLDHKLGKLYASVVRKSLQESQLTAAQITAIGNHGQTVFHHPDSDAPFTMQLGDANIIAAETGIDTVADFRRIDMALGGQGAPLVPAYHQFLFKHASKQNRQSTTVVLNVGGIANISVLPGSGQVCGFDTGPGNVLMDAWCQKHLDHPYDNDGQWATGGKLNENMLKQLMSDPYISKPPPKSTGREHYNLDWLLKQIQQLAITTLSAQDVQRTLCEFTVHSIAEQLHHFKSGPDCELLVCGGGANNPLVMERLQYHLPQWHVMPTTERGIPVDAMEAMAFAWLARQRIHNQPGNLPAVTGARCQASLGVIYPAVKESI